MKLIGKNIDTSSDEFGDLIRRNCLIVDKTAMIQEFVNGPRVSIITRPRRFGKTLTLSMLQHFLSAEVGGKSTNGLFDSLIISKIDHGQFLKIHQGQYPVIFITFKDLKESTYEESIEYLRDLIKKLYREHKEYILSSSIDEDYKKLFETYLEGLISTVELQLSLTFLSEILFKAHGKKAFILIDEYDTPLTNAYQHTPKDQITSENSFLCRLSDFMRNLFSAALKTNIFLEKGLITGILRVSKNNMLSGLNNPDIYTLLEPNYAQYFGFTGDEVDALLQFKQNTTPIEQVRSYYNGYIIGGQVIYNPWSVMKFLANNQLEPYWVRTSNDNTIRDHLIQSDKTTQEAFHALMLGEIITGEINVNLKYEDLIEKPSALWTLLFFCGYLTSVGRVEQFDQWVYQLKIPNDEIRDQYRQVFSDWLKENMGHSRYYAFLTALLKGDVSLFMHDLSNYLIRSLSFRDVKGENSEKFYHGFVLGLMASVRKTHHVKSNAESGSGLPDLLLIPKDNQYSVGIVMEFKYTTDETLLKKQVINAMAQMHNQKYDSTLKDYPCVKRILKIGIAFCSKAVLSAHQTSEDSEIIWSDEYLREKSD